MFYGEHQHALDGKNRLFIPAKFREPLPQQEAGRGFYVSAGLDRCLFLFTPEGFDAFRKTLSTSVAQAQQREFQRTLYASTEFSELDSQGRILIPAPLKEWASLSRDAAIIGVENRVEVWDLKRWRAYKTRSSARFEKNAGKLI